MGYMCLFQFWFPQGICLGVRLLGLMVALFLVCLFVCLFVLRISIPSTIVALSITGIVLYIWYVPGYARKRMD